MNRKVRLHPLPDGASPALAEYLATVITGAISMTFDAHAKDVDAAFRGMFSASLRKRIVNQLVCAEGAAKLRELLGDRPEAVLLFDPSYAEYKIEHFRGEKSISIVGVDRSLQRDLCIEDFKRMLENPANTVTHFTVSACTPGDPYGTQTYHRRLNAGK